MQLKYLFSTSAIALMFAVALTGCGEKKKEEKKAEEAVESTLPKEEPQTNSPDAPKEMGEKADEMNSMESHESSTESHTSMSESKASSESTPDSSTSAEATSPGSSEPSETPKN